jgi:hypothetical protein
MGAHRSRRRREIDIFIVFDGHGRESRVIFLDLAAASQPAGEERFKVGLVLFL